MQTTNLTISNTTLIPYGDNSEDLLEEYALKLQLETSKKSLNELESYCEEAFSFLNVQNLEEAAELERLKSIYLDKISERSFGEDPIKDEDDEEEDHPEDVEIPEEDEVDRAFKQKLHKQKCKSIYNFISKNCHPDKTSNASLHSLFVQATAAYRDLDLDELLDIEDLVKNSKSNIKSVRNRARASIAERISSLKRELNKVENSIREIRDNPDFIMFEVYHEHGPNKAKMFRLRLILDTIDRITSTLKAMATLTLYDAIRDLIFQYS